MINKASVPCLWLSRLPNLAWVGYKDWYLITSTFQSERSGLKNHALQKVRFIDSTFDTSHVDILPQLSSFCLLGIIVDLSRSNEGLHVLGFCIALIYNPELNMTSNAYTETWQHIGICDSCFSVRGYTSSYFLRVDTTPNVRSSRVWATHVDSVLVL